MNKKDDEPLSGDIGRKIGRLLRLQKMDGDEEETDTSRSRPRYYSNTYSTNKILIKSNKLLYRNENVCLNLLYLHALTGLARDCIHRHVIPIDYCYLLYTQLYITIMKTLCIPNELLIDMIDSSSVIILILVNTFADQITR